MTRTAWGYGYWLGGFYHREVWKSITFGLVVALVWHWMDKRL